MKGPGLEGTGRVGDDLWLLAHNDVTGRPYIQGRSLGLGLAGALLAELVVAGALVVACEQIEADSARHQIVRASHADTGGLAQTTPDRAAAALWIPGDGPAAPPEDYPGRLAALTGPHLAKFQTFDQALDRHHPAGVFHHHLAILAVHPERHGYTDHGQPIHLPYGGPPLLWPMWRAGARAR